MGYVIKKTSTATKKHPTRAGQVIEFILIKGGYVRYTTESIMKSDQYKSKGMATRVMNKYVEDEPFNSCWDNKYEVVEV